MEASEQRVGGDRDLQVTLADVIRACDAVFGTTTIGLAVLGVWLLVAGRAHVATVVALWLMPIINLTFSVLTRGRRSARADLLRGALSLPLTTYLYIADQGALQQMWLPSLIMTVGISTSLGIATRRSTLGFVVTFAYSGALVFAAAFRFPLLDAGVMDDALGIVLTGCVMSIVASRLGCTLDEARRQRDDAHDQKARAEVTLLQLTQRSCELTTAIESLHHEMEHRMRVEIELHQAQKLESVGRLAAGVAHEINTPVQFVSDSVQFVRTAVQDQFDVVDKLGVVQRAVLEGGASQAALAEAAEATEAADLPYLVENVPKALDRAIEGLDRVSTIVRSMKEFAHPDTEEMAPADLNRAIASTLTVASNEYKYVAELETDFGALPLVNCHVGELNQAVLNIVVNAAHAIGDVVAGTGQRGHIRVRTYRDGDDVIIAIADTGGGIPDAIRARIFDPFFTTKEVGRGTGQGLAIARPLIVDKHRGALTFETELTKGTTFFIRLPIDGGQSVVSRAAALEHRTGRHQVVHLA